ncbi:cysteine dioxygenase family protein [Oleiagrimonas sp. C23AA]|uniref:cysteine dioxygenase n=1 Tax=Oleiagrimonas sp. C23AA TaxID=2719047 RepID=UPI001424A4AA|nr:cysteine dioxygenase family protein [Oleiagrimonas sp. C23AA]NII09489.1 hypothetical protein [Oleiagrimonas sp. C23AA]
MKSMFDSITQDWTHRVLQTMADCLDPAPPVRRPGLAEALTSAVRWEGCPRANQMDRSIESGRLHRLPLADPADTGYSVLLIVWPAGYTTPIHDHDGLWGIELVLDGVLEVTSYQLTTSAQPQLVHKDTTVLGIGDHTMFSGADYAHQCRNASLHRTALSLHVYGGDLQRYQVFQKDTRGHWTTGTPSALSEHTFA